MSNQRVEVALSPCPNDVFILSGLLEKKIATPLEFSFHFADIETLNALALKGEVPVIKTSFALYPRLFETYEILSCGSALGFGVGPLLVSKRPLKENDFSGLKVAIPGRYTTANFLYDFFFEGKGEKLYLPYHEIVPALLEEKADLGVLIHEGRFVYEKYGLVLIADLGELWEKKTGAPLPLGGFLVKRELPRKTKLEILRAFRDSLIYGLAHKEEVYPLLKRYAQELEREVIYRHVETFVNNYTFRLEGKALQGLSIFFDFLGLKEAPTKFIFEE